MRTAKETRNVIIGSVNFYKVSKNKHKCAFHSIKFKISGISWNSHEI